MGKKAKIQEIPERISLVNDFEERRRIGVTYSAASSNLKRTMKGLNIDMVPSNRMHQLKSGLGSPKDRLLMHEFSGIYKEMCPYCGKIGQTKRPV